MRCVRFVILAVAFCAAPAAAQPVLMDHWDEAAIVEALKSLGATDIFVAQGVGHLSVIAKTADGLNVGLFASGCRAVASAESPSECKGLEGVITYDIGAQPDRASLAQRLNRLYAGGKFTLEGKGGLRLSRYLGFEGGIAPANLRSQLGEFFAIGAATAKSLWPRRDQPPANSAR